MCAEPCGPSVDGTDEWRCTTMQERRFIRWTVAAVLAAAAIALAACSGSETDKAGGADEVEPRVLTMAVQSGVPGQMSAFAEDVSRLSNGTLEITFKDEWRLGEPTYEAGTLEDVRAGKVDMAWVGARAFDTVGVTSFQALLAPQLIDSYDLEAKVFEEGIPDEMLKAVDGLGLVGIGVLPGPMRKMLGISQPFVAPADFAGHVVGIQDSAVAKQTFDALGATPKPVPAEAPLDGLDAYEQQLASIEGNAYDTNAKYVTSNVNLWPRPLVIVIGNDAYDSLTDAQRSTLRDAAESAIPKALAASRAEDKGAVEVLCGRGLTFATASETDLAELRSAFEPVYAALGSDAETKSYLDAIFGLKSEIAASAEEPGCAASGTGGSASSAIPEATIDGVYRASFTREELARSPLLYESGEANDENWGELTLTFDEGRITFEQENDVTSTSTSGTYELEDDAVVLDFTEGVNAGERFAVRWSLFRDKLTFERDEALGIIPTPYVMEPWNRVE